MYRVLCNIVSNITKENISTSFLKTAIRMLYKTPIELDGHEFVQLQLVRVASTYYSTAYVHISQCMSRITNWQFVRRRDACLTLLVFSRLITPDLELRRDEYLRCVCVYIQRREEARLAIGAKCLSLMIIVIMK